MTKNSSWTHVQGDSSKSLLLPRDNQCDGDTHLCTMRTRRLRSCQCSNNVGRRYKCQDQPRPTSLRPCTNAPWHYCCTHPSSSSIDRTTLKLRGHVHVNSRQTRHCPEPQGGQLRHFPRAEVGSTPFWNTARTIIHFQKQQIVLVQGERDVVVALVRAGHRPVEVMSTIGMCQYWHIPTTFC